MVDGLNAIGVAPVGMVSLEQGPMCAATPMFDEVGPNDAL